MPESQQVLVQGTVYDAIQQSLIQLEGYYLIPQDEVGTAGQNNIDAIRLATAADEIITTHIQCHLEACTVTLSRLLPDNEQSASRLRVQNTRRVDVLTDNYLSVAAIISRNMGGLYAAKIADKYQAIEDRDYAAFIALNNTYRMQGANPGMLDSIDGLQPDIKKTPSVQRLYREVALDLYTETHDKTLLDRLKKYVDAHYDAGDETSLYNVYNLQIVEGDFPGALATAKQLS